MIDDELRGAVERAFEPADPVGVFDAIVHRRNRRRQRTRVARAATAGVAVVAVVAGAVMLWPDEPAERVGPAGRVRSSESSVPERAARRW
jgi:hypothetical protein